MKRLAIFFVVLLLLAIFAFFLSFRYLFPHPSVQECNKLISEEMNIFVIYGGYQSDGYQTCISSVAYIKREKSICRYISDDYDREKCYDAYESPGRIYFYRGYYEYHTLIEHISACDLRPLPTDNYCMAVSLAKRGN